MSVTTTIRLPAATKRRLATAARARGLSLSRYLVSTAERDAAGTPPATGLGRELEKLAIDGMARLALARVRERAAARGLDKLTPAQIVAEIKAARRDRRARV